jgi:hypothetical protein
VSSPPNILLHSPVSDVAALRQAVEDWLRDGVTLVAVWGPDCERTHDLIDGMVEDDGSDPSRFLMTSWHDDETLAEARKFAAEYDNLGYAELKL